MGVKFSTNGSTIDSRRAADWPAIDYVDVQISIDGADAATNDAVRGAGSYAAARRAMDELASAGFGPSRSAWWSPGTTSASWTPFAEIARHYGAQLRVTRLRPSGRGAESWAQLHPTAEQQGRCTGGCSTGPRC